MDVICSLRKFRFAQPLPIFLRHTTPVLCVCSSITMLLTVLKSCSLVHRLLQVKLLPLPPRSSWVNGTSNLPDGLERQPVTNVAVPFPCWSNNTMKFLQPPHSHKGSLPPALPAINDFCLTSSQSRLATTQAAST